MFGQRPVGRFAPPVSMFFLLAAASLAVPAWAQAPREIAIDLEDGRLDGWEIKGDVRIERIEAHGGRTCLRIGQKGEASLTIAPEDGFGTVEMWVYDSGFAREGDAAKERAYGPLWGLTNSAAERLVFGLLWAPYLSGNGTYGWISTVKNGYASRQYARVKRGEGWHRWEFIVTNETDIVVRMDEKYEATAFDVMTAAYHRGFNGVFFRGGIEIDEPLLVDDIRIAYQPEPLAPRTRPLPGEPWKPPDLEPLHIKPELVDEHPRLFFTAEQIPDIRRRCQTTHQSFFETLMSGAASYLKQMPPEKSADCSKDQDMQQWAWWRLGVLSFAYVATGERQYGEKAKQWLYHCDGEWSEAAPGRFAIQKDDVTFGVHLLLPESPDCPLEPDTVRVTVGGLRPRVTYTLGLTGRKANVAAGADGGLVIDVEVGADTEKLEVLASPRQFKDRPFTD